MQVDFLIKEPQVKKHQIVGFHLLSAMALFLVGLTHTYAMHLTFTVFSMSIIGIALFKSKWYLNLRLNTVFRLGELIFLLYFLFIYWQTRGVSWIVILICWLCVLIGLLTLFEQRMHSLLRISLDERGITVHKFIFKKHISWKQLASVNVHHNTLTLIYKDQHMKQWVYDNTLAHADEVIAYATAQIEKNTEAITNDW
jgi:hypothetical protein